MEACDLRSESSLSCTSSCSPLPSPDLSSCHRCGLRFPVSDTIDRFRTLDSQWRIVLLCYDCLDGVKSAKVCSYCFLEVPVLEQGILSCIACSCRVHRACVPLHHRYLWPSQLDADKFICVDCCPVHIFRGKDLYKSGSRTGFRFLLEGLVREAKSISEKEVITEGKLMRNSTNRAMVARSPTEIAKTALGAVHSGYPHTQNSIVPDQDLALCLHRSINGSLRISKTFCLKAESRLHVLRRVRESSGSVGRVVGSNSHHVKIEAYSENKSLLEDRETSQSILTDSLLTTENEDQLKQLREYNPEGPDGFSVKEKDILYMSSDTTSDCSNVGSASLPMNCLLNNTTPSTKFRFGDGEGSSELQRKAIDAAGSDMCAKKYFRR